MKARWNRIRPRVLERIKPTPAQTRKAQDAAKRLSVRARAAAKAFDVPVTPYVVGSLAKDTHLRPKPDIDLFLLIPTRVPRAQLERVGVAIGKKILSGATLRYAEHPYVRGRFAGFEFDVVPAYQVESGAGKMSAVDRSPFHAEYVRKHLSGRQQDEVRLLKQFFKGIGCYGAETATGGFSGYMAELLVLRFGTFWDVLEQLEERAPPIRLALEGDPPPLGGDLVFVDPVDPARNAAAAVQREKLDTFLRAARAFTSGPRLEFFWPRPDKVRSRAQLSTLLEERGVLGVELPTLDVGDEALVPHVRRFADKVVRALEEEGFRIVRQGVYRLGKTRSLALWEHEPLALPAEYVHMGPPVDAAAHSRRFLEKWQTHPDALELPHPVDGRWQVRVRRTERDATSILARRLPILTQGLDLSAARRKQLRPRTGVALAKSAGLQKALGQFLVPRDPWDDA